MTLAWDAFSLEAAKHKTECMDVDNVHYVVGKQSWNSLVVGSWLQPVVYSSQRSVRRRKYQYYLTWYPVCAGVICSIMNCMYSVSQKSSPPKNFAIFSLMVNLCNWKLPWLLFLCLHQFWSIYLNIYMNCIIFTSKIPQILTIQFRLLRIQEFFVKK